MRTEDHRRGGPRRDQSREEFSGHRFRVGRIPELRLFGQGALIEPVEQRFPEVADGSHLRQVDVGVHESGDEHTTAEVDDLRLGVRSAGSVEVGA